MCPVGIWALVPSECYLGTSLPLPAPSLPLPSPSLPQSSDQRLIPMSRTQSFLRSFVTAASLRSKFPKPPPYPRLQPPVSVDPGKSSNNSDLGIDIEDPADITNSSDHSQPSSDKITKPLSTSNEPSEPAELVGHLSVLADILVDYELDDSPVTPRPSRSSSLPSIALDSPHATVVALSKESPLGEQSLPRERESLASLQPSPERFTSADPWSPPLSDRPLVELSRVTHNLSPSSPSILPAIALEIETFGPFSPNDLMTFRSPRATVAVLSKESLPDEWSPPREHESLSSSQSLSPLPLPLFDRSLVELQPVAHKSPSSSPALPLIALEIKALCPVSHNKVITLGSPRTTGIITSEGSLWDEQSVPSGYKACLTLRPSPDCFVSADLRDPSLSLSTTESSPLIAKISPYTPPASLSTPLASPASPTSLDIELLDRYPAVATAPESSGGTPAGMCITDDMFEEEERPSDESSDELSSSTGTTNLALATHYDRHSTVLTGRRQRSDPSPALSGSRAAYPSAINAVFWALVVSRFVTPLDDGTLAPPPSMPPPSLQSCRTVSGTVRILSLSIAAHRFLLGFRPSLSDSLIAVIGPRRSRRSRYRLDSVESTGTCPPHHDNTDVPEYSEVMLFPGAPRHSCFVTPGSVLDVCCFQNFVVAPTRRVLLRRILLAQSCKLPHICWWPIFILSLVVIYFFSLLANGPFHLAVSHLLVPQASCAVTSSISLVFLMFWLIFATLLCSPVSRATFMAIFPVFHVSFASQLFLYKVSLWSLELQMYFVPSGCSRPFFLSFRGYFRCLMRFSAPFVPTPQIAGGQYPKSQGEAASHLGSSALATRYNQGPTVPNDIRQSLGPLPVPSGARTTRRPLVDAALWVLLASWLLPHFDDRMLAPPPSALPPFSRPRQLVSGAFETVFLVIATSQILSSTRDWSDLAETPTSSLVLDSCLFPGLTVTLAQRVLPPRLASTRSQRLPCFQQSPVSIFAIFLICFFPLFTNGPLFLVVSHLLIPQASHAVTFSVSLTFAIFRLIFMTDPCSRVSRATFVVIISVFHIFFVFRAFLYRIFPWSLAFRMYFSLARPRFILLIFLKLFFPAYCISLPFLFRGLAPSTEDGRYPKSQGGATGHLVLFPRSPALATLSDQGLAVPKNPCQRLGLPSALVEARATRKPSSNTMFRVVLASWPPSLLDDETPAPLPTTTFPLSQPHPVTSRIVAALPLPVAAHRLLSGSKPSPPKSQVAVVRIRQLPQIRDRSNPAGSFGTRLQHHDDTDILEYPNIALFLVTFYHSPYLAPSPVFKLCLPSRFAVVPVRPVSSPQFLSTWSYRLHHFRWFLISVLSLFTICFFFRLANDPFGHICFRPLVLRVVHTTVFFISLVFHVFQLCLDECPSFPLMFRVCFLSCPFSCSIFSRFHQEFFSGCCVSCLFLSVSLSFIFALALGPDFLFGPASSFGLAFSFSFAWLWSRVFDQGWSSSEVPRRGSQPLGLVSQIHESTTHPTPPLHESSNSTPRVPHCPCATHLDNPSLIWLEHKVAIREKVTRVNDRSPALTLTQPRLTEQFHHGYISPKFSNYPLSTSGQIPDRVAPSRDFRDQTTVRNGLQCPDHRSFLPRSPERIRIFHRSNCDGSVRNREASGFHHDIISDDGLLARALGPRSRDDGGTSSEGFLTSRYDLEITKHLACSTASFSELGRHSPTRDGWNLKSQGDDPLPSWGAPESLDTVGSHLATLSNHQHSLATS